VPDVHGLALRDAVYALQRAGFRARLAGGPPSATDTGAGRDIGRPAGRTVPAAGASAAAGALVTVYRAP
jgi:hypothetical protein